MHFFAAHYWQFDNKNTTSLVLQQAYHKKRRMPVLLACVERNTQKEDILSKKLSEWFYGTGLSLCSRNGEEGLDVITGSLEKILKNGSYNALGTVPNQFTGIMCVGEHFLIFRQGMQRISLLNIKNHHSNCRDLAIRQEDSAALSLQTGIIQQGVGILLATEGFRTHVPNHMIEECLNIRELQSQNQVGRRLGELGAFAEQHNGKDMGAVLIVTG